MKVGEFITKIKQEEGYRFRIDFESEKIENMFIDEPEPLGKGEDPNAGRLLAAAVGDCMCASLLFCLQRSRVEIPYICADVYTTVERNERGRLRITSMTIKMFPVVTDHEKFERCREIFEDFCIVSQSVKKGIDIKLEVYPAHEKPKDEEDANNQSEPKAR